MVEVVENNWEEAVAPGTARFGTEPGVPIQVPTADDEEVQTRIVDRLQQYQSSGFHISGKMASCLLRGVLSDRLIAKRDYSITLNHKVKSCDALGDSQ